MEGYWSVDFAQGADGQWYLIDMAEGDMSWQPDAGGLGMSHLLCPPYDIPRNGVLFTGILMIALVILLVIVWFWGKPPPSNGPWGPDSL